MLEELIELAISAAKQAGRVVQSATLEQREAQHKQGGTSLASQVVTEVDLESQRVILNVLEESIETFQLGILTEESADDTSRYQQDYFWCIDPLDGTLPFVEGKSGYSVSIALVSRAGVPQLGVIFDPETGILYHGSRGSGAFRNGRPWGRRSSPGLTLVMDRSLPGHSLYSGFQTFLESLPGAESLHLIDHGGAALNACWVMENAPAVYVKFPKPETGGGSVWDFAASACLVKEAGGAVSDIRGQALQLNRSGTTFMNAEGVIYASEASLAGKVVRYCAEQGET